MNDKFDELAKGLAQSVTRTLLCLTLVAQFAGPARASEPKLGPLIDLSDPDALAACGSNGNEKESYVAVNPANPKNIVTVWWGGQAKAVVTAVTFDGGKNWQQVVVPGVTVCTGGKFDASFDPWLSFSPSGDLFLICVVSPSGSFNHAVLVSKSTDGGLHWGNAITLFETTDERFQPDKPSITADPKDSRFVYAIWDGSSNGQRGPAVFSRTTDGGDTWEPPRAIVQTAAHDYVQSSQIFVLPDGTLIDLFSVFSFVNSSGTDQFMETIYTIRSSDRGLTWSAPMLVLDMQPLLIADFILTFDPENGQLVQDPGNVAFAADRNSGNLYAAWEDARFSNFQYNNIAFSMSADGGFTWSAPIPVNKTPSDISPASRQAFLPAMAVNAEGTIGVSYYDFRNNTPKPGLPTDDWLVLCHPSAVSPASDPANWGEEVRLTGASFDIENAPVLSNGYFIGDYQGLATVGNDFLAAWSQPHDTDHDSVFFRRVGP